jgi:hypothetical protein
MQKDKKMLFQLGHMNIHEYQVFILFLILIALWFFKTPLFMPGWGDFFDVSRCLLKFKGTMS